jgi:hypothetical protein
MDKEDHMESLTSEMEVGEGELQRSKKRQTEL